MIKTAVIGITLITALGSLELFWGSWESWTHQKAIYVIGDPMYESIRSPEFLLTREVAIAEGMAYKDHRNDLVWQDSYRDAMRNHKENLNAAGSNSLTWKYKVGEGRLSIIKALKSIFWLISIPVVVYMILMLCYKKVILYIVYGSKKQQSGHKGIHEAKKIDWEKYASSEDKQ